MACALALAVALVPVSSRANVAESMPLAVGKAPLVPTTPLPVARQMHGAAVLGDFIYVVGGHIASGFTETVQVAPILPDGTLGPWKSTTPLPQRRGYIENGTLALDDILYVAGGYDDKNKTPEGKATKVNTVAWAKPGPDGQLGPWRESPPWPGPGVNCMTVVVTPGFLHVLGGYDMNGNLAATVNSGRIAPEGGIAEWVETPPLPRPLWFHHAGVAGGRVWVWGGLHGGTNRTTTRQVLSCPVLSDGRLGSWREEPHCQLPVAFYSAACTSVGNYLISLCPRLTGGSDTSDIWFATVDGQRIGAWHRMISDLTATRYVPIAPDFRRGLAYVPGGRKEGRDLATEVFILRFAGGESLAGFDPSYFVAAPSPPPPSSSPGAMPGVGVSPLPAPDAGRAAAAAPSSPFGSVGGAVGAGAGMPAGFLSLDQARRMAEGPPRRPMLLYFHHDAVALCAQQKTHLVRPEFAPLAQRAAFAWVEVRDSPQLVQQLGVFRVPAWVLYDSVGNEAGRVLDVLTLDQLQAGLDGVR